MTTEDLQGLQGLFQIGAPDPITLRAIRRGLPTQNLNFLPSDFPEVEARWGAFAQQAQALNAIGYNIYTCLNPIRHDFQEGAVTDADIVSRRLLLIDLDRKESAEEPASDEEVKSAAQVADDIEFWLSERCDSKPTRTMSGNGIHLYYRLGELPNDDNSRQLVRDILNLLARKFGTDAIKIDTSVSNASRITKVPGTLAHRGQQAADRPFRKAVFL